MQEGARWANANRTLEQMQVCARRINANYTREQRQAAMTREQRQAATHWVVRRPYEKLVQQQMLDAWMR
jgi:hypothetical protein